MVTMQVESRGRHLTAIDMRKALGSAFDRLPFVLRILLENNLRHQTNDSERLLQIFRQWLQGGRSQAEIPFRPGRLLMHDTTCVPALVDIAAMRDAIAEAGGDPTLLSPKIPVDVSVDHSIGVDRFGVVDALRFNLAKELERNAERYRLMKWATTALPGLTVHPPGTGIMHTINLEQLATVIATERGNGVEWAVPDTLIGTDSHTPMINGIGVLAWGVGGLEAESVMFGMPVMLNMPEVVGVRLLGRLQRGALSTDLALAVTEQLRSFGVSGKFVEFFGPGVSTLSAGDRAVVANMAPEYGATTGFFPVDVNTVAYLRATGRSDEVAARVEHVAKAQGLWFDPDASPRYTDEITIDLGELRPSLAGPRRPQDRIRPGDVQVALERCIGKQLDRRAGFGSIPDGAVAIAAITSCTNTSDPALLIAAGLLARKARQLGLKPPHWIKTSLAPGSPTAVRYLQRSGLLADLEAVGFSIVGFGCTTCIGNSGPLPMEMQDAIDGGVTAVAVLSGNRNFPGRVHPSLQNGFLASPPMTVAFALAGDVLRDITADPIGTDADGNEIYLVDLWPEQADVERYMAANVTGPDYPEAFRKAAENPDWQSLEYPQGARFPWSDTSTYIRRPPFAAAAQPSRLGKYTAAPLLVLGNDITTDHISPAGQISATSYAGRHLVERGESPSSLNVFAARRGNWEVMVRGLFDNRAAANLLLPDGDPGHTMHGPSGDIGPLWEIAERYRAEGTNTVIIAGERYGAGSSRDWAAKGVAMLGVRAVIAKSFERIHRSNLIGMGILPINVSAADAQSLLGLRANDHIIIDAEIVTPRCTVEIEVRRSKGGPARLEGTAAVETDLEADTLTAGGMIPFILSRV
ncbi:MAG: aconitate hydratase AcnA [Mesorhizobium sp.]|uniref:aconitate hydratase AcnA n=1 Tax=Mesorhizobium sp. TaxID=1871066 RepID=UPI00121FADA8|nr:aconitate hydratase AcnA [Mesorhizobium sp.]TIO10078.1 MAG: aconitate hydratase AcnA [Mesorhizobium sp.]TIP10114.1 MAG: aconitate hydratase AcnA [Mesorhizobium sp.]